MPFSYDGLIVVVLLSMDVINITSNRIVSASSAGNNSSSVDDIRDSKVVIDMTSSPWTSSPGAFGDCSADYSMQRPTDEDTDDYNYSSSSGGEESSSSTDWPKYVPGIDGDLVGTNDVIVTTHYGRVRGKRIDGIVEAGE